MLAAIATGNSDRQRQLTCQRQYRRAGNTGGIKIAVGGAGLVAGESSSGIVMLQISQVQKNKEV
jgi:hypothetical protein